VEGIKKELQAIEKEVNSQSYAIARRKLLKLQERTDLTKEDQIKIKILLSRNVFHFAPGQDARYELAKETAKECQKIGNQELLLEAQVEVARGKYLTRKYDECFEVIQDTEKLLETVRSPKDIEYKKAKVSLLNLQGLYHFAKRELKKANKVLDNGLKLVEKLNCPYLLLEVRYTMLRSFTLSEFRDKLINWVLQSIEIADDVGEELWKANFMMYLAYLYLSRYADLEKTVELNRKAMAIFDKYELEYGVLRHMEATVLWSYGEYDKALEIYEAYPLTFKDEKSIAGRLAERNHYEIEGNIAYHRGDFDKAIECYKEFNNTAVAQVYIAQGKLDLALELILEFYNVWILGNIDKATKQWGDFYKSHYSSVISEIYYLQGNYELAMEYVKNTVEYRLNIGENPNSVDTSLLIIRILYEQNELELNNEYVLKLEEMASNTKRLFIKHAAIIGKAIALKASSDPNLWSEAIKLLDNFIPNKKISHASKADAMIILCELLIREFSYTGDLIILQKLESYTDELEKIAYKQNSFQIKLEATHIHLLTLWLKAQYSIAEIDLEKAKILLIKIRDMADKEGLLRLAEKITHQHDEIIRRIDQWAIHVKNYYDFLKD
jgi:tetratricopeptide (TPR) repeat protein